MNKVIGRLAATATRRRDERDVRVHADAGRVGSPAKHRTAPRDAAGALRQIEAEAPVQRFEGYAYAPHTLTSLRERIDRNRWEARLKDRNALALMDEAEAQRREADDLEHLLWLGEVTQELRTEVPQQVDEALTTCRHAGCTATAPVIPGHSFWCSAHVGDLLGDDEPERVDDEDDDTEAEQALDAYIAAEAPHDEELPEALTSGPAAVPQLVRDQARGAYSRYVIGDGDPDTVRLAPVRDGETRTDIPAVNGAGR